MRQATEYIRSTYSERPQHASDCPVYTAGVCTCAADVECPPGWRKPGPVDCKSFSRPVRPLLAHTSVPPHCDSIGPDRYFKYPIPGENCETHAFGPDSMGCVGLLRGDPTLSQQRSVVFRATKRIKDLPQPCIDARISIPRLLQQLAFVTGLDEYQTSD